MTCKPAYHVYKKQSTDRRAGAGKQGFQTSIADDSFIVDGMGAMGTSHSERGLTYYEVALSGHMYGFFIVPYMDFVYSSCPLGFRNFLQW